jgi:hypothetical protein
MDSLIRKSDLLQTNIHHTNTDVKILLERQKNIFEKIDLIVQSIEKTNEYIQDEIESIKSKKPQASWGDFLMRNKMKLATGIILLIGAVAEMGRVLYKMVPPI